MFLCATAFDVTKSQMSKSMNRSSSYPGPVGIGFSPSMMCLWQTARVPRISRLRHQRIPALLSLFFVLFFVSPSWSQEHEVPQFEIMGGYSYLRSSDMNFNGWKATVVGNVNSWLGIAVDFDGDYAGGPSEHSITVGPHFVPRKNKQWSPIGYALFGVAFEKSTTGETDHGFSTELGGGLDYELTHRWTVRVFDVTASITRIGGETKVSPKVGVGLVINLGHR